MLITITIFGTAVRLHTLFDNIGIVASAIVGAFVVKDYKNATVLPKLANLYLNKKRKDNFFWRWGFEILGFAVIMAIVMCLHKITGDWISLFFLGNKDANYFPNIFVSPIAVFVLAIPLLVSPLKAMDIATPVTAVALIFFKISCFCAGCCYGVEWAGGMMNEKTGRVEFPIQLVEAACAVIMFVVVAVLYRKKNYKTGLLFPLFMLMYCGSRFISEFWRDDYPGIVGPLKAYHIQCIIGFVEGLVFLLIVLIWGERITAFFERRYQLLLERQEEKVREKRRYAHHKKKKS